MTAPSAAAAAQIEVWETFLNRDDPKHAMTARYLYEHFFLASLRFGDAGGREFFRLVRSTTPPGQPIATIATVRPYDDPGVAEILAKKAKDGVEADEDELQRIIDFVGAPHT